MYRRSNDYSVQYPSILNWSETGKYHQYRVFARVLITSKSKSHPTISIYHAIHTDNRSKKSYCRPLIANIHIEPPCEQRMVDSPFAIHNRSMVGMQFTPQATMAQPKVPIPSIEDSIAFNILSELFRLLRSSSRWVLRPSCKIEMPAPSVRIYPHRDFQRCTKVSPYSLLQCKYPMTFIFPCFWISSNGGDSGCGDSSILSCPGVDLQHLYPEKRLIQQEKQSIDKFPYKSIDNSNYPCHACCGVE